METSIESEKTDKSALLNGSGKPDRHNVNISTARAVCLAFFGGTAQIIYGTFISLTPPFYPTEAESRGATPSQVGFVYFTESKNRWSRKTNDLNYSAPRENR